MHSPVLLILVLIPLLGAIAVFALREAQTQLAKQLSLFISVVVAVYAVVVMFRFDTGGGARRFQFVTSYSWIKAFGVHISFGVDGIALVLVTMAVLLVPAVLLSSWNVFDSRAGSEEALPGSVEAAQSGRPGSSPARTGTSGTITARVGGRGASAAGRRATSGPGRGGASAAGPRGGGSTALADRPGGDVAGGDGAGSHRAEDVTGHGGGLSNDEETGVEPGATFDDRAVVVDREAMARGADGVGSVGRHRNVKNFFALILLLEFFMIGVFTATDVFLFYVFFEAMLVPMYFIIGSYGGPRRQYAAMKFFLYSLLGGLLMLASVIGLYLSSPAKSFSITDLLAHPLPDNATQKWLFLGFFIAFAIKAPLVPFHTWLPDAGAEAPAGGAALLVGVLDKVGTFGLLRYCLPLFPAASRYFAPLVLVLSVIGVLYAAFLAIGQRDMKRLAAYTSVAHFGFIGLGIFAFTTQSDTGAVFYMVNHGFSTGALFIVIGLLIARGKSRNIDDYGGVAKVAPVLAGLFLLTGLSSLALPGMSTFISEFLVLVGTFTRYKGYAIIATTGIVLAAIYVLYLYQRTFQGAVNAKVARFRDVNAREVLSVAPLIALILFLGVYPKPVLDIINPAVKATLSDVHRTDPTPQYGTAEGGRP